MVGIELVQDHKTKEPIPAADIANYFEKAKDNGLVCKHLIKQLLSFLEREDLLEMFLDSHHQCVSMKMMLISHLMFLIDHFHNKNKFLII
jgi:hypothetical protein